MMTPAAMSRTPRVRKAIVVAAWAELVLGPERGLRAGWQRDASCANDGEFLYEGSDRAGQRKVCADCPVAGDCLRDALESEDSKYVEAVGVRAGLTPRQRKQLRAQTRRAASLKPPAAVPSAPPRLAQSSRADFVNTVAGLVAQGATYEEAVASCEYQGREQHFYRRLWRAGRLDLHSALRDASDRAQGAA